MAAAGADAKRIASAAVAVWDAVHRALAPVIGPRGSAALHHRVLHVARATYPWLDAPCEAAPEPGEFDALRHALGSRTAVEAAAAHDGMLQTFLELLTTLIGEALTTRLLGDLGDPPSDDISSQDSSR